MLWLNILLPCFLDNCTIYSVAPFYGSWRVPAWWKIVYVNRLSLVQVLYLIQSKLSPKIRIYNDPFYRAEQFVLTWDSCHIFLWGTVLPIWIHQDHILTLYIMSPVYWLPNWNNLVYSLINDLLLSAFEIMVLRAEFSDI